MIIRSPQSFAHPVDKISRVFLAGSIEMGKADNWQKEVELAFESSDDILLLNPRRTDRNSSWIQDIHNPEFNEQVNWELQAMETADLIIMYFAPGTLSPVTLLELGLQASSGKLVVCCPEGFQRKGNVDIVCRKYKIPQVHTIEELILAIHHKLNHNQP